MNFTRSWLTVLCLLVALAGCGGIHERRVVVIEKTKTYHRAECPPVHMAKAEEMPLSEAKARNFKACPLCKPDNE